MKNKICVHVASKKDVEMGKTFAKVLEKYGIVCNVVVDEFKKNCNYPYYTFNEQKMCVRRIIKRCRNGGCK